MKQYVTFISVKGPFSCVKESDCSFPFPFQLKRELVLLSVGIGTGCAGYCLLVLSVQVKSVNYGVEFSPINHNLSLKFLQMNPFIQKSACQFHGCKMLWFSLLNRPLSVT